MHSEYKEFITFVKEFIYENNLLFWFQDLKMKHGFLGVQLWDLTP